MPITETRERQTKAATVTEWKRRVALDAAQALEPIPLEQYSYARNSLMAAYFPEMLEEERAARRVIPEIKS